jgi:hypothetical protein
MKLTDNISRIADKKFKENCSRDSLKEDITWQIEVIDGSIIFKKIEKIESENVNWFHLAQDRDQWACVCKHGDEQPESIKTRNVFTGFTTISVSRKSVFQKLVLMPR